VTCPSETASLQERKSRSAERQDCRGGGQRWLWWALTVGPVKTELRSWRHSWGQVSLRRREKNATEAGAGRFEKPAPDARAAPPEAHESLISRKTGAEVPLTGLSIGNRAEWAGVARAISLDVHSGLPGLRSLRVRCASTARSRGGSSSAAERACRSSSRSIVAATRLRRRPGLIAH
jgi:hypothetical protein